MNSLSGKILQVDSHDHLSLVDVDVDGDTFSSIVIETPATAPYLRIGEKIRILFKETEVSIGKNFSGDLSLRNRIPATILAMEEGRILTGIVMDYRGQRVGSIITTRSARRLGLRVGDEVVAFVKANEVTLMQEKDN